MNDIERIQSAAIQLAERARLGDQVAMGTLVMVGINARKGNKRAKFTYDFLQKWTKANPVLSNKFGAELLMSESVKTDLLALNQAIQTSDRSEYATAVIALTPDKGLQCLECAAVTLANGPDLFNDKSRVIAVEEKLDDGLERKAYQYGIKNSGRLARIAAFASRVIPTVNRALRIGFAVGLARRIQGVRMPDVPISILSKSAAWELGE